ncbi:MAG: hypothetical protein GXO82_07720 [Chlorobi bacterium]|nr:hypothetical protein [Chlorobiota bacterium]
MEPRTNILHIFADLLSYPTGDYKSRAEELVRETRVPGEKRDPLKSFREFLSETELGGVEELFTRTFDMNKNTCLEIGWHLYGEDYKRGEFLVRMRQALAEFDIPESVELPDHISHCLKLIAVLDPEDANIFVARFLRPALDVILGNFEDASPFKSLVVTLRDYLNDEYDPVDNTLESNAALPQAG